MDFPVGAPSLFTIFEIYFQQHKNRIQFQQIESKKRMWQLMGLSRARAPHISHNDNPGLTSEFSRDQVNPGVCGRHHLDFIVSGFKDCPTTFFFAPTS